MAIDFTRAEQVINGSFGEIWAGSEYLAEARGIEVKIKIDYAEIHRLGCLYTGSKMLGYSGSGTLKLNKVTSRFNKKVLESLKEGKQFYTNIITKINDPDSRGEERYLIKRVVFEELTIANFENKKALEEDLSFRFEEVEPLSQID